MKSAFTYLIISLLSPLVLLGQEFPIEYDGYIPKKPIQEFGIFAGPSLGFLRGSPAVETNNVYKRYLKLGYTIGVSATHRFSDKIAIKGLALRETKGGIVKAENTYFDQVTQAMEAGEIKNEFIYTSYSFPLMFSYTFGRHLRTQVSMGPYASYLKKQIVRTTFFRYTKEPFSTGIEDQSGFNKTFEWGAAISVSEKLVISEQTSIVATLINIWGLTDTRSIINYGIKTNNTNVMLGVIFKN